MHPDDLLAPPEPLRPAEGIAAALLLVAVFYLAIGAFLWLVLS